MILFLLIGEHGGRSCFKNVLGGGGLRREKAFWVLCSSFNLSLVLIFF